MRAVFTSTRPAIARLFFVGLVAICMMALLALPQTAARAEDGSAVGSLESASPAEDSEAGSVRDVEDDSEDAEQEPAEQEDQEEVEALDTAPTAVDNGIPVLIIATKVDKIGKNERAKNIAAIKRKLGIKEISVLPYSSLKNEGRSDLLDVIGDSLLE